MLGRARVEGECISKHPAKRPGITSCPNGWSARKKAGIARDRQHEFCHRFESRGGRCERAKRGCRQFVEKARPHPRTRLLISAYLKFSISYFSASRILCASGNDFIYLFHPGHQPVCHLHIRPSMDLGFWSYFARNEHWVHLFAAILPPK